MHMFISASRLQVLGPPGECSTAGLLIGRALLILGSVDLLLLSVLVRSANCGYSVS